MLGLFIILGIVIVMNITEPEEEKRRRANEIALKTLKERD